MNLVFFDIDGTLLTVPGAGHTTFSACILETFGWEDDLSYIRFAGATDLDVVHQVCRHHGHIPLPQELDAFFLRLPAHLESALQHHEPIAVPGGEPLLTNLSKTHLLGLITGNEETCARKKLSLFGLDRFFPVGAYGHEQRHRCDIARLAVDRAHTILGSRPTSIHLIGDTPSDIDAAHSVNAVSIALTSHNYSRDALA